MSTDVTENYIFTNYYFFLNLSFYADFGPLNLAMLYRYCCKLNKKLKVSTVLMSMFRGSKLDREADQRECCVHPIWLGNSELGRFM